MLRASTVVDDEIICGIRSLWKRVSMGSCEIPGVLTRAIYHARSVFAYVVKGPRRLRRGHGARSRVPFEIRVFANTPSPPHVSPHLFISPHAFRASPSTSTLFTAAKQPSILLFERITRIFYRFPLNFNVSRFQLFAFYLLTRVSGLCAGNW